MIPSPRRARRTIPLLLVALALVATACVPTARNDATEPVNDDAHFALTRHAGYDVAYEVAGSGPPVVLIHGVGGGSSLFQYRRNVPALTSAGYRSYAVDLHGFGRSGGPEGLATTDLLISQLTTFLDDVVAEPAVLVANGLSAAYAIRIAAESPERVAGLVLIGPTGYERLARPPGPEREAAFGTLSGVLGEALYATLLEPGVQRLFLLDAYAGRDALTPEVLTTYDRNLRTPFAKWAILSFVTGNLDQDVSEAWPRVEAPSLIVWGTDATTTPIADAEPFLRARPDTAFLPLADAKLLPNEDRADAFDEAVLAFLRRIGW
ncbi:MAG: alpha/beta hydrolase [Trueperaceae bacterium]